MALETGTTLGPYEITAELGKGGMGEVYRATDTKLDRDVALKILPEDFASDPERLARFQREAKVLAALNHPNIAAIYGLEDSGETHALVLELVEGPTLADRISQGAIPLDEALPIAKQIAEALEAAHEQGIIHRDLKPANIKVTPDGVVKVLDFGLAKALEPETNEADAANSPTMSMTAAATKMGMILGTAAYMSPEQARGKPVDTRTDIWAFGVVLYEMLVDKAPFVGEDVTLTLAEVVRAEPDWQQLPSGLPASLAIYLRRCLEKEPRQRVRDIGDVRLALEGAFDVPESGVPTLVDADGPPAWWQRPVSVASVAAVAALVTGALVWSGTRPAPASAPVMRFPIVLPPGDVLTNSYHNELAASPDGAHLAYTSNGRLYLRALDQMEPVAVRGSEGATEPFFSHDSQWLAFHAAGELKKVAVSGGTPVTVCELTVAPYGATWGADDTILFNAGGIGVHRVPGSSGTPELVIPVELNQVGFVRPQLLPGGEWVLFSEFPNNAVAVQSLVTGERRSLVQGGGDARYVSTGHLLYVLDGTLLVASLDVETLTLTSGPVPLVDGVRQVSNGIAALAVSDNGTLFHVPGNALTESARSLVWVDRSGAEESIDAPPRGYGMPRLAPDGSRVALTMFDVESDVWVWDFDVHRLTRLTFAPEIDGPAIWTPDGERIVFTSTRDGSQNLFWKPADGTGEAERLTQDQLMQRPMNVSPDGRLLLLQQQSGTADRQQADWDVYGLSLDGEPTLEPVLSTVFPERNPALSPDGRWLAYESNENSASAEIFVRPFPEVDGGRWQLSNGFAAHPLWAPDGQELFYRTINQAPNVLMAVEVDAGAGASFRYGNPEPLFDTTPYVVGGGQRAYDVSPDGQRFLMVGLGGDEVSAREGLREIHVTLNFFEELKARVPTEQ